MQISNSQVNVVVAHPLEAKALIPMLGLQPQASASNYPLYGESNGLQLIVSGIGKEAVAKAVAFLANQQANDEGQVRGWLNIGIAGHADAELGSAWLANKITDLATHRSAYPPQLIGGIPACGVVTVDEPERVYPQDAVYEMEASAFYAEACSHATAELVQLYKIVSDNLENPISALDLKRVPVWIGDRKKEIESLVHGLSDLVSLYNDSHAIPPVYREICMQTHLTVSQKLQLKRLCQRYRALGREGELADLIASAEGGSRHLIGRLAAEIDKPFNPR